MNRDEPIFQKPENAIEVSEAVVGSDTYLAFNENEHLAGYDPKMTPEAFKQRYAGLYQKDDKRLSPAALRGIWRRFVRQERHAFFAAHTNFTIHDILRIGIDKFVYTMGWKTKADVARWHNNKVRVGVCAHCSDQFIPMILQHNFGLCNNCKPLYSAKAIRNFIVHQMNDSRRYHRAHRDLLMDFFILFYRDHKLRPLFLKGTEMAKNYESLDIQPPDWYEQDRRGAIDIDGDAVPEESE